MAPRGDLSLYRLIVRGLEFSKPGAPNGAASGHLARLHTCRLGQLHAIQLVPFGSAQMRYALHCSDPYTTLADDQSIPKRSARHRESDAQEPLTLRRALAGMEECADLLLRNVRVLVHRAESLR